MVYSDDSFLANRRQGGSTLQLVTSQLVEEPVMVPFSQAQVQRVAQLCSDQRIFGNAPQYHWHIQGSIGADEEAS